MAIYYRPQSMQMLSEGLGNLLAAIIRRQQENEAMEQFQSLLQQTQKRVPVSGVGMDAIMRNEPLQFETQQDWDALTSAAAPNPMLMKLLIPFMQTKGMAMKMQDPFGLKEYEAKQDIATRKNIEQWRQTTGSVQKQPSLPTGYNQITDPKVLADLFNKTHGTNLDPSAFAPRTTPGQDLSYKKAVADSKRVLLKSQKIIRDFESNPNLMQNYQKIVNDPEFSSAVNSGNVDLATTILARLVGDTTPQKVLTKRYFDYIKALNDVEGELAYLKELGVDTKPYIRQTKKENPKDLRGIFSGGAPAKTPPTQNAVPLPRVPIEAPKDIVLEDASIPAPVARTPRMTQGYDFSFKNAIEQLRSGYQRLAQGDRNAGRILNEKMGDLFNLIVSLREGLDESERNAFDRMVIKDALPKLQQRNFSIKDLERFEQDLRAWGSQN